MLNLLLLLGEDLLAEAPSWKLAPGETLRVGVAGGSQPHKTAALAVAEPKEERKSRLISRKSSRYLIYLL